MQSTRTCFPFLCSATFPVNRVAFKVIPKELTLYMGGIVFDVLYRWQKVRVVSSMGVRWGMQNQAPVHPVMKYLQALASSITNIQLVITELFGKAAG